MNKKNMGKNRTTIRTPYSSKEEKYVGGTEPQEPSKELVQKMLNWQGGGLYPDHNLSKKDIQFVKDNMKYSDFDEDMPTGQLTRVERAYHFLDNGFKEGDILNTKSIFRAFSREPDATIDYSLSHMLPDEPIVIYRTNGHVPHYNITEHTGIFKYEKESWVETGKLKIDKIQHFNTDSDNMLDVLKKNMYLDNYPEALERLQTQYEGTSRIPQDVIIVDLSPTT